MIRKTTPSFFYKLLLVLFVSAQVHAQTAAPTTTIATQVYAGDTKTVADLQVTGTGIKWYAAATGGTV